MQCALWYWCHGSVQYELYDDELSAARGAVYMTDAEYGSPAGVQMSDGTYTPREQWDLYKTEDRRIFDEGMAQVRADMAKPQPPTRTILAPFTDRDYQVKILADAPAWLGRTKIQEAKS